MSKLVKKGMAKMWARRIFKIAYSTFSRYVPGDVESLQMEERMSHHMFAQDAFEIVIPITAPHPLAGLGIY